MGSPHETRGVLESIRASKAALRPEDPKLHEWTLRLEYWIREAKKAVGMLRAYPKDPERMTALIAALDSLEAVRREGP